MKMVIFLCLFIINTVIASENISNGDPAIGKTKSIICWGCHGVNGNNSNPLYPILAGQGKAYLIKQLLDFKKGLRKEEHMDAMVEAIELSDIPHIASYFSKQIRETPRLKNNVGSKGEMIYLNGIPEKSVMACATCHATKGTGNDAAKFPALAGQHRDYLKKTLKKFKNHQRHNDTNKIMRDVVKNLSDKEIKAVTRYLSK